MAVELAKTQDEIMQLPLVDLAYEILKVKKEPFYFRDLMREIQQLREMSEDEVMEVIARLYTEINIDGRFLCIGQNIWGLKRWYPVDKVADKASSSKRFVRRSGDAFSDDDEDLDEDYEDDSSDDEEEDSDDVVALFEADGDEEEEEEEEELSGNDEEESLDSDDDSDFEEEEDSELSDEESSLDDDEASEDPDDDEEEDERY